MLGPVLSKAARRKSVPRLCSSLSISPPSNIGSRYSPAALDQCRKSSSKPSSPPNDDAPPVAAPTDAPKRKQTFSKMGRTKPKEGSAKIVSSPPSSQPLPSVPSTQHLQRQDVHIASFFAFHRPISVNTAMPIAKTEKDFSKIFIPCSANRPKSTQVMLTLSSAVESLDKATQQAELQQQPQSQSQFSSSEQDLRAIVMQASQSNAEPTTAQGQIAVYVNIDELAAKFRPFRPPPPPVPMPDMNDHDSAQPAQATPAPQLDLPVAVVEEISEEASEQNAPQTEPRHPFLNRLYVKHLIREGYLEKERQEILQAISVKRQRKLKMKKHKYKKLMKRTRNLRRRQDRL